MKPTVPEVLPMAQHYYSKPGNSAGGCLHIVLEDGNVEDKSVLFCLNYAKELHDADGVALANALLQMSKTQRLKLASKIH